MTAWDVLTIAAQRWLVTVLGLVLTVGAVFLVTSAQPSYLAQVRVVLLPPATAQPNGLTDTAGSLISLAGVVAKSVADSDVGAEAVSESVTLTGEGRREGYTVRQPNAGGQWQYRFDEPVLDVQAVGSTDRAARQQLDAALRRVDSALADIQDLQGVPLASRVRTILNPEAPQVDAVGGSDTRAMAATVVAGLLVTVSVLGYLGPRRPGRRGVLASQR
ncbi:hypothetical protein [Cryobacterium arcticum]|uniref:Polysaccharide chain length determinant N-terminal domain-containing protein n=1 Tax=Cryobacterium arcticum TaxID=670052 RepID=A0A317ZPU7_9MICO|nr:hypothetical protein [Cryobacterium arcticum]PXA65717.1 hypothetical protein CTB96_19810 [Cryobacterium arcticum]